MACWYIVNKNTHVKHSIDTRASVSNDNANKFNFFRLTVIMWHYRHETSKSFISNPPRKTIRPRRPIIFYPRVVVSQHALINGYYSEKYRGTTTEIRRYNNNNNITTVPFRRENATLRHFSIWNIYVVVVMLFINVIRHRTRVLGLLLVSSKKSSTDIYFICVTVSLYAHARSLRSHRRQKHYRKPTLLVCNIKIIRDKN